MGQSIKCQGHRRESESVACEEAGCVNKTTCDFRELRHFALSIIAPEKNFVLRHGKLGSKDTDVTRPLNLKQFKERFSNPTPMT